MLDEKLELVLLSKFIVGQCRTMLSRAVNGHGAVKAGSTGIGVGVDSTLSDHGSHGERAHSRLIWRDQWP